ncbi:MAG: flagellar export chaperone FliS [Granulosicoccus sp.]|nr:flagellar export chaperone FliS [Granulosicoccus sp.]
MSIQTQISSTYEQVNLHAQIEGANAHELIDLLLKNAIDRLSRIKGYIGQNNIIAKGNEISKVISIVAELQHNLSVADGNDISTQLASLYNYINELLIAANMNNDIRKIEEVAYLMTHLRESWNMIPRDERY